MKPLVKFREVVICCLMKAHSENDVQSLVSRPDAQPDAESDGSIAAVAAPPGAPGHGVLRRVLVVEDDPLIGEDIACTLDECGFSVVGRVQTLGDAMQFVQDRAGQLDCVVLDIDLGGQSCQPLVALLETQKVPYALITAHSRCGARTGVQGPRDRETIPDGALVDAAFGAVSARAARGLTRAGTSPLDRSAQRVYTPPVVRHDPIHMNQDMPWLALSLRGSHPA